MALLRAAAFQHMLTSLTIANRGTREKVLQPIKHSDVIWLPSFHDKATTNPTHQLYLQLEQSVGFFITLSGFQNYLPKKTSQQPMGTNHPGSDRYPGS
jgi:hypothetical protein